MATVRKSAVIYIEVGTDKKQVSVEELQKAVKAVSGAKKAFVNAAEGKVYCTDADGEPVGDPIVL